ncbi:MAG: hypothetical protein ACHRXM_17445 [Isosphaerales bacterium]
MTAVGLEFIVDGFVQGERFTVIGCCGDAPIQVGDVFDAVYRNKRRRYPDELGDEPVREVEKPAAIRVVCIHAYERSLNTLGEGMTGSLTLEGDGLQYLAPGWILGRKSESPTVVDPEPRPVSVSS